MQRSGVLQRAECFFMPERGDSSARGYYYFVPVGKSVFSFSTCKHGYSVGRYEFVLQVRIRTPYAGGFGMAIPNQ
jgi:hypothetical protein